MRSRNLPLCDTLCDHESQNAPGLQSGGGYLTDLFVLLRIKFSSLQFSHLARREYTVGKRGERFPLAPGVFTRG